MQQGCYKSSTCNVTITQYLILEIPSSRNKLLLVCVWTRVGRFKEVKQDWIITRNQRERERGPGQKSVFKWVRTTMRTQFNSTLHTSHHNYLFQSQLSTSPIPTTQLTKLNKIRLPKPPRFQRNHSRAESVKADEPSTSTSTRKTRNAAK